MINWSDHPEYDRWVLKLREKGFIFEDIAEELSRRFSKCFTSNSIRGRYKLIKEMTRECDYDEEELASKVIPPSEPSTEQLIELVQKRGYAVEPITLASDETFKIPLSRFKGKSYKHGLISDTHLCSKEQQLSFLRATYDYFESIGIKDVFHTGDLSEGNGKLYRGQIYELFINGADNQKDYIVENYPHKKDITTYIIGGSHDYSWYNEQGYDILKHISDERKDILYLGNAGAYIDLVSDKRGSVKIYLHHPDGGVPYAISYRAQKIIENFAPEAKPDIMYFGHLHVTEYIPMYRNVCSILAGCFQAQTPYLRRKGLYPHIGFWVIEIIVNDEDRDKPGIAGIKTEFRPFYVPKERDY